MKTNITETLGRWFDWTISITLFSLTPLPSTRVKTKHKGHQKGNDST